jgi:signal transduction histidine kinase
MAGVASLPNGLLGFGGIHVLAAGVTAFLAIRMRRYYRGDALGQSFSVVAGVLTVWTLGAIVELATRLTLDPALYAAGAAVKFVGVMAAPVAFVLFALRYDGRERWIDRRLIAGLAVVPVVGILLALTTVSHGLFYAEILETTFAERTLLYGTVGPGWWLVSSFAYLLLFGSTLLFVHAGLTRWPYYRFETGFVLAGIGLTWVTNLTYVLWGWPHPAVDPTPIGLTVTAVLLAVGIFSTRPMDVPLPGHVRVYETIQDAIVVIDDRNRVIDANGAATELLDLGAAERQPAEAVLPWPIAGGGATETEPVVELAVEGETRYFSQRLHPVGSGASGWTVLVLTDITDELESERLRAQRDAVAEQRDYLETLNEVVRHDIRNDLQVVSAYAEMLEPRLEGESREYARTIRESAAEAVAFTKTAGDLAATMLASETALEPIDLRETLWSEVDLLQSRYDRAVLTVADDVPAVSVAADDLLGSVFRNLIENAIRHNDSPVPRVRVGVEKKGDRVQVRIADNGPGVPERVVTDIFEKGEMDLETGGTGLGLYLVDALVDRYGGDVWVEDNEPTGSVFVVELATAA